jgi:hypothetical protein
MPSKYALSVCCSGYADNQLLSNIKHCNRLEQILARSDLSAKLVAIFNIASRRVPVMPHLSKLGVNNTPDFTAKILPLWRKR